MRDPMKATPALPAPIITEKALQAAVVELARALGYAYFYAFDSRRSPVGWPDLILCRPPRLLAIELKSEKGRMRPGQREWLLLLGACPGIETYVWRPRDWRSGAIEQILTRSPSA